jgi:hypothetical protein
MPAGAKLEDGTGTWQSLKPAPGGGTCQGKTWRGAPDLTLLPRWVYGAGDLAGY